jgi:hypothetical protein
MIPAHGHSCAPRLRAAFLLGTAVLAGWLFLSYSTRRPPRETVGFAEFRPAGPAGHPTGLTVRLNFPPGFRARYAREDPDVEAGVADAKGSPLLYVIAGLLPPPDGPANETPLRRFAQHNDRTGDAGYRDVSAEFRTTRRGAVWLQRYTDLTRRRSPADPGGSGGADGPDHTDVLRYAEE